MTLDEAIKYTERSMNQHMKGYTSASKTLSRLNHCREISDWKLMNLYTGDIPGLTKNVTRGKYKYILGGDGRSAAWDEDRVGEIMTLNIDRVYLSSNQEKMLKDLIRKIDKPDEIIFKYS